MIFPLRIEVFTSKKGMDVKDRLDLNQMVVDDVSSESTNILYGVCIMKMSSM